MTKPLYILNLEDGQVNLVVGWGKGRSKDEETPIILLDECTTKGVHNWYPWHPDLPLVIERPEDYIPAYELMKKEGIIKAHILPEERKKSVSKWEHPLARYKGEWLWDIANTWHGANKGMLLAGGFGERYTHCWMKKYPETDWTITLNNGDDGYLRYDSTQEKADEMWELLKIGAPLSWSSPTDLGFYFD